MNDARRYYASLETRLGNQLLLNGRAHLGLYPPSTWRPFPIQHALLAMEDHMFRSLDLHPGTRGLRVLAIDLVGEQVQHARQNVRRILDDRTGAAVTVQQDDYHRLKMVGASSLDGIYTIETLVHTTDLSEVLKEFLRALKPGGRVVPYEYDHWVQAGVDGIGTEEGAAIWCDVFGLICDDFWAGAHIG
ncbi:S-adenosyl-L-methionine-dependent methyltransferase [Aspergillus ambiguus]|uniref:class I SAM-dependent methyltransferase n=1 Tax=Aspergillus ambiguus TaxID=176160 RepID=UPI003CCDEA36